MRCPGSRRPGGICIGRGLSGRRPAAGLIFNRPLIRIDGTHARWLRGRSNSSTWLSSDNYRRSWRCYASAMRSGASFDHVRRACPRPRQENDRTDLHVAALRFSDFRLLRQGEGFDELPCAGGLVEDDGPVLQTQAIGPSACVCHAIAIGRAASALLSSHERPGPRRARVHRQAERPIRLRPFRLTNGASADASGGARSALFARRP